MKRAAVEKMYSLSYLSFGILVGALLTISVFQSQAQTSSKVGYANADYIYPELPDAKQIEARLKTLSDQLNKVIETKDQEWRKKFTEYVANEKDMLEAVRNNMLSEIEQIQANVEKLRQDAQTELQQKEKQMLQPVYQKILKAISEVAQENGYTLILSQRINGMSPLLYAEEKNNISNLVLKKLGVTPKPATAKTETQGKK